MQVNDFKIKYIISSTCIAICLFIITDAYFIPLQGSLEVIKDKQTFEMKSRRRRHFNYHIETDKRSFDPNKSLYLNTRINDTIHVFFSPISKTVQQVQTWDQERTYTYSVGFMRNLSGLITISIFLIILISTHVYYFILKRKESRKQMTLFSIIIVLILLFTHLELFE